MICPPLPPARLVRDWIGRHRHPPSLVLHLVGIPLSVLGVLLVPAALGLGSWRVGLFSLQLFVAGYGLQFLGHALEWTEPGEIRAIRSALVRRRPRPEGRE